ncbi:MAG: hypothetical protein SFZ03_07560 [Candidatus Melainabacteria bacterium]|nr:hypothetical protein [Candidatus Melainabacteria bacterium]
MKSHRPSGHPLDKLLYYGFMQSQKRAPMAQTQRILFGQNNAFTLPGVPTQPPGDHFQGSQPPANTGNAPVVQQAQSWLQQNLERTAQQGLNAFNGLQKQGQGIGQQLKQWQQQLAKWFNNRR